MSDIGERVKKIVVEHLGVEPDKVTEAASFIDDLGADSLDTVELVMAFEEEFHCEIPDDAAETILTVGENDGFAKRSGMIRFVVRDNKVRLRINVDAARAAKLTISSKLLRVAEIVNP